jgi:hypothetical protein
MTENLVTINSSRNYVVVTSPGPQGPRGRTILNGSAAPSNNLGLAGDFYYNTVTTEFYGPKPTDLSWAGATVIFLTQTGAEYATSYSWGIGEVAGPVNGIYSLQITHNLGFYPNVTVKTSAGDVLETGIDYNSINQITLTMAQPFSGTAYLS